MTAPPVVWGGGRRKKRTLTEKQKAMAQADLCDCPSCCAAHPERLELKKTRRREYKKLASRLSVKE